jgi:small subunit ribosomal protein S8e
MTKWQGRSLKKATGGRIWPRRGKRRREMGSEFIEVKMAPVEQVKLRTFGGNEKRRLYSADVANITDQKTKKVSKAKILSVVENKADLHFVRRNVITKGAIIQTELGRARVTSRPGQHGVVNAVLLETQ